MRALRVVLVAVVAATALGGCARSEARPSGVVERWLQAVGDQGRDGLRDDAQERAAKYGDPSVSAAVVPDNAEPDERHFSDLEVGKAVEGPLGARVPFRVTARLDGGEKDERTGTAVLARRGDKWFVTAVEPQAAGERVPSAGGPQPARAAPAQWLVALLLGIAITFASVLIIEAQPKRGASPAAN